MQIKYTLLAPTSKTINRSCQKKVFMVANSVSPHTFYCKIYSILLTFLQKQNTAKWPLCFVTQSKNQIQKHSENKREVELYFTADHLGQRANKNLTITIQMHQCISCFQVTFLLGLPKFFSFIFAFREAIKTFMRKTSACPKYTL